jgi:hypothetical protein
MRSVQIGNDHLSLKFERPESAETVSLTFTNLGKTISGSFDLDELKVALRFILEDPNDNDRRPEKEVRSNSH